MLLAEAAAFADILGVSLQDLLRDPGDVPNMELLEARVMIDALRRENGERWRQFEEAKLLWVNTSDRLAAAQRRLAELEEGK